MTSTIVRCVLHIGAAKTGSTALQQFLASNESALSKAGWSYPAAGRRAGGHHDLAFLLGSGYPHWATTQPRSLQQLKQDLAAAIHDAPRVILSSENFHLFVAPERASAFLADIGLPVETVRVVMYVRRQDESQIAWYNQVVKAQGYAGTFRECLAESAELWDYAKQLAPWADVFGTDAIVVRPYHATEAWDVRRDFLQVLGVDADGFLLPQSRVNPRLSRDLLEFQRVLNRLPLDTVDKRAFHRDLMELSLATAGLPLFDDSPFMTSVERRTLLNSYRDSNRAVARTYLGRDDLFPTDVPADVPADIPTDEPDHVPCGVPGPATLTCEKLLLIVGWLLARRRVPSASS